HGSAKRVFNFGGGFEPEQVYGAEFQLDAEVEYRIGDRWSVALGGQNLTDEYPDLSNEDIYYFGNLPYDVLSPIGSNGAYYYSRIRYTVRAVHGCAPPPFRRRSRPARGPDAGTRRRRLLPVPPRTSGPVPSWVEPGFGWKRHSSRQRAPGSS